MADDLAEFVRRDDRLAQGAQSEQRDLADERQCGEDGPADTLEHDPTVCNGRARQLD
jgi:hypothetical protein